MGISTKEWNREKAQEYVDILRFVIDLIDCKEWNMKDFKKCLEECIERELVK